MKTLSKALVQLYLVVFRRIGEYISLELFFFVNLTSSCSLIPWIKHYVAIFSCCSASRIPLHDLTDESLLDNLTLEGGGFQTGGTAKLRKGPPTKRPRPINTSITKALWAAGDRTMQYKLVSTLTS